MAKRRQPQRRAAVVPASPDAALIAEPGGALTWLGRGRHAPARLRRLLAAPRWRPTSSQLRKLAIVPAYNEQGMVGRVVREIHRHAPDFDVVVVDDGSTDEHRGRGRGQRRGRPAPSLQHRDRRRDAVRLQVRAPALLRRRRPGRRRRPAQARPPARPAGQAQDHGRRGRHGLRQPLPRRSRLQGAARPPGRQPDLLGRPDRDLPPADQRPDLRLPDDEPARDRAVRARLPARLPRGRGDPDAARAPAADPRGAGADERPRLRPQLDRLPAQRLLHGQGAAGAVRGPVPPAPDPRRRPADQPRAGRCAGRAVSGAGGEPKAR